MIKICAKMVPKKTKICVDILGQIQEDPDFLSNVIICSEI
jgi:hypothetical protein